MTAAAVATGWRWDGEAPTTPSRLVVIAPHPDDEVLGAGGLLVRYSQLGVPLTVVAVTDGEASHASSVLITPEELRHRRVLEREAAFEVLGLEPDVVRLALPDGGVANEEQRLVDALVALTDEATTVVAPSHLDGHRDHVACASAVRRARELVGFTRWQIPIWSKVASALHGTQLPRRSALMLPPTVRRRKAEAVACFTSQLVGLSDDPVDGPVVRPAEVQALLDGREEVEW